MQKKKAIVKEYKNKKEMKHIETNTKYRSPTIRKANANKYEWGN